MRHNPAQLLMDPYARAIEGEVRWGPSVYGHVVDDARLARRRVAPVGLRLRAGHAALRRRRRRRSTGATTLPRP